MDTELEKNPQKEAVRWMKQNGWHFAIFVFSRVWSHEYMCCVHKSNGYEYDDILQTLFGYEEWKIHKI